MPRSRPYKTGLSDRLKNADYAAAYLNAAMAESRDVFLLALRDVAEAHKISHVASVAGVNRETLYRTLSPKGNPTFDTLKSVLMALGVEPIFRARVDRRPSSISRVGPGKRKRSGTG
jgi:probable addiction module antidote protein